MRVSMLIAVASLMLLAPLGCGSKGPKLPDPVPVTGTVLLDGKPLANAIVTFQPEGDKMGNGATGRTDDAGKYELTISSRGKAAPGAIPGKYRVLFSQLVGPDGKPVELDPDKPPAEQMARESLPIHLSTVNESNERVTVGESGGTFDFKLSKTRKAAGLMPR